MPARPVYRMNYPRAESQRNGRTDVDPLGLDEIAAVTGRERDSVYKWFQRGTLPPWDGPTVWGNPTWRRRTLLAWAFHNGFLPDGEDAVSRGVRQEAAMWAERIDARQVPRADHLVPPEGA